MPDKSKQAAPPPPKHQVEVLPVVRETDVPKLSQELKEIAARIVRDLFADPYIGEECDPEHHLIPLPDCYKVKFDESGYLKASDEPRRGWRPAWRFIYRIEDGEVKVVAVVAIQERKDMLAYELAKERLAKRDASTK